MKNNNNIYSFLIEHYSLVFDTPTLLRQGGHPRFEELYFLFWHSPCDEELGRTLWSYRMVPQLNQQSIYQTLFNKPFPPNHAMEDFIALRRIVFDSHLNISRHVDRKPFNISTQKTTWNTWSSLRTPADVARNSLSSKDAEFSHQATDFWS